MILTFRINHLPVLYTCYFSLNIVHPVSFLLLELDPINLIAQQLVYGPGTKDITEELLLYNYVAIFGGL